MAHPIRNSLLLASVALILGAATLTACGGGGGGPTAAPGPIDPPGPSEPPDPAQPPTHSAGQFAINGIDQIPQDMLKLSKKQMQSRWVLAETNSDHGPGVGRVACQSYVVDSPQCERSDWAGKTRNADGTVVTRAGNSPFTELLDLKHGHALWNEEQATRMGVKIVTAAVAGSIPVKNGNPPYLLVVSAGNFSSDFSWLQDRGAPYNDSPEPDYLRMLQRVKSAVAADKLLFVAGYDKDASGNYVRHRWSSGCKDSELVNGCLWTQYDFPGIGDGTSLSSPQVSAAIASVLAVFDKTTPQNLAKFAKSCAKKTGNGIPMLLAQSGGVGVADFSCMGNTIAALRSLPTGGRANVTVNGQIVNLGSRDLVLSFAQSQGARYFANSDDGEEPQRISFRIVPNGEDAFMAFTMLREGALFASLGAGKYDSFFGYKRGHGEVLGIEYAAGHENLFLHLTDIKSSGGDLISHAEGRSLGLAAEQEFHPAEQLSVTLSASLEKFLGGGATIPFGEVDLNEGEWNRRLGVSAEYAADQQTTLGLDTRVMLPGNGETTSWVGFRFGRRF